MEKLGDILKKITETKGKEYLNKKVEEFFEEVKKELIVSAEQGKRIYVIKKVPKDLGYELTRRFKTEKIEADYCSGFDTIILKW